jgi:peptidoglycan/xylan/chitin deacetylase (PgdA/CDA1 family)
MPLLERRGIPATFFINSAYFEGNGHFWCTTLNWLRHKASLIGRGETEEELERTSKLLRWTTDPVLYGLLRAEVQRLGAEAGVPRRQCVSPIWLEKLNPDLFAIGAHAHEHERYSMMSEEWQIVDLRKNVECLRQFTAYRPMFAYPFGRKGDFDQTTIRIASEMGLSVWGADGGINLRHEGIGLRIPADGLRTDALFVQEMLKC